MELLSILGVTLSAVGAGVSFWQARKAISAAAAAQAARQELSREVHQHQRAEALNNLVREIEAALKLLKPFYEMGEQGPIGGMQADACGSLADVSVALSDAIPELQSDLSITDARIAIEAIDEFSEAYKGSADTSDKETLLSNMFKKMRDVSSIMKGELRRSRRGEL